MTQNALKNAQNQLAFFSLAPKQKAPQPFKGKDSVPSWTADMNDYLASASEEKKQSIEISYGDGHADELRIVYKETEEGRNIANWLQVKDALINIFETLNKEKVTRDKLAKWKQPKDVATFNDDFQNIILRHSQYQHRRANRSLYSRIKILHMDRT